jgi:hypothetical protein
MIALVATDEKVPPSALRQEQEKPKEVSNNWMLLRQSRNRNPMDFISAIWAAPIQMDFFHFIQCL